jgi:hypothetical protein
LTFSTFFEAFGEFDWVAILVGAVAIMVLGWLWYGPLFGKAWSKGSGIALASGKPDSTKLVWTFVYSLVFNIGLAFMTVSSDEIEHALVAGIVVGVFLVGAAMYSAVVWANYNKNVYMIDVLFWILAAAVGTFVQGMIIG